MIYEQGNQFGVFFFFFFFFFFEIRIRQIILTD